MSPLRLFQVLFLANIFLCCSESGKKELPKSGQALADSSGKMVLNTSKKQDSIHLNKKADTVFRSYIKTVCHAAPLKKPIKLEITEGGGYTYPAEYNTGIIYLYDKPGYGQDPFHTSKEETAAIKDSVDENGFILRSYSTALNNKQNELYIQVLYKGKMYWTLYRKHWLENEEKWPDPSVKPDGKSPFTMSHEEFYFEPYFTK